MAKKKSSYVSDPNIKDKPLRLDEVDALILSNGLTDISDVPHLLSRVSATIKEQRRRMAELQRDIELLAMKKASSDHPIQRALDALNEMNDDEKRVLLDQQYLAVLDKLTNEKEAAERARLAFISESNRVRFLLTQVIFDESISKDVRKKLEVLLAKIPTV
ncbi:MAG: hypothetical protein ACKOW9_04765 [Candidatus Paceibacterota bacterium]